MMFDYDNNDNHHNQMDKISNNQFRSYHRSDTSEEIRSQGEYKQEKRNNSIMHSPNQMTQIDMASIAC